MSVSSQSATSEAPRSKDYTKVQRTGLKYGSVEHSNSPWQTIRIEDTAPQNRQRRRSRSQLKKSPLHNDSYRARTNSELEYAEESRGPPRKAKGLNSSKDQIGNQDKNASSEASEFGRTDSRKNSSAQEEADSAKGKTRTPWQTITLAVGKFLAFKHQNDENKEGVIPSPSRTKRPENVKVGSPGLSAKDRERREKSDSLEGQKSPVVHQEAKNEPDARGKDLTEGLPTSGIRQEDNLAEKDSQQEQTAPQSS